MSTAAADLKRVATLPWPPNAFSYARRPTRVVYVGSVGVGGNNPLRVQSMTTTDTMNTDATVAQVLRLAEAGCEIARITAPTVLDAKNLEAIKSGLINKKCDIPLVADIHFRPDAAMVAADFVEKVRINPGNFVDGKAFKVREYTDVEYQDEIRRIEDKFTPLVLKLKKLNRALRIGTNHGSLSDRIMNRYGDTPEGMVESALEYARICERNEYFDLIFSMKASNPRVMISAYRLLVKRMSDEGMAYPLHVGVTEAGDGEDGRIKSAAGIGGLLEDGIGDTIRVSLTEDPEYEIPVAQELTRRYQPFRMPVPTIAPVDLAWTPSTARRETEPVLVGPIALGGASPIRVVSHLNLSERSAADVLALLEDRLKQDAPPEILRVAGLSDRFADHFNQFRSDLSKEQNRLGFWVECPSGRSSAWPLEADADGYIYSFGDAHNEDELVLLMDACRRRSMHLVLESWSPSSLAKTMDRLKNGRVSVILSLRWAENGFSVHAVRQLIAQLQTVGEHCPVLLQSPLATTSLDTAVVLGALICDGVGDAICTTRESLNRNGLDFSYNLLQACGSRLTKTEFVSCPSCGRTLFDLQSTTERIKSKTGHLKGVKIAIMGCIVNGPGEMADADFGYVGGGPGKINLYVGKTCVEKSIPSDIADDKLIELIKSHDKWVDPPTAA
jgi:(E)-4-hydroxy-3-methylbut-2-enyl-diphosphate synthase